MSDFAIGTIAWAAAGVIAIGAITWGCLVNSQNYNETLRLQEAQRSETARQCIAAGKQFWTGNCVVEIPTGPLGVR